MTIKRVMSFPVVQFLCGILLLISIGCSESGEEKKAVVKESSPNDETEDEIGVHVREPHPLDSLIKAHANDTLYLEEGVYLSQETMIVSNPIVIMGKGKVEIVCDDLGVNVIDIYAKGNVVLDNIRLRHKTQQNGEGGGCTGNVIWHNGADTLLVQNCEINGCGQVGLYAEALGYDQYVFLKNNHIHSNSWRAIVVDDEDYEIRKESNGPLQLPNFLCEGNKFENNGFDNPDKYPETIGAGVQIPRVELETEDIELREIGSHKIGDAIYPMFSVQSDRNGWEGIVLLMDSETMFQFDLPEPEGECLGCFHPSVHMTGNAISIACFPSNRYEITVDYELNGWNLEFVDCEAIDLNEEVRQQAEEAEAEGDGIKYMNAIMGWQYPKGYERKMRYGLQMVKQRADSLLAINKTDAAMGLLQETEDGFFESVSNDEESDKIWKEIAGLYLKHGNIKRADRLMEKLGQLKN